MQSAIPESSQWKVEGWIARTGVMADMWWEANQHRVMVTIEALCQRLWQCLRWWTPLPKAMILKKENYNANPPLYKRHTSTWVGRAARFGLTTLFRHLRTDSRRRGGWLSK